MNLKQASNIFPVASIDSIVFFANEYRNSKRPLNLQEILDDVCRVFDVTRDDVFNARRYRRYVKYRQLFAYVALQLTEETTVTIGKFMGYDHSTVVHSNRICRNFIETEDYKFLEMFNFYKTESKVWRDKP